MFAVGGAQAIAAMAYGTETIPRVAKIVGPGNAWVTAAKIQVAADPYGTAIDMPAGPSELMVIANYDANAAFIAADLLAQAEHGPDSQVSFLTDSEPLLQETRRQVLLQLDTLTRKTIARAALENSVWIVVDRLDTAVDIANRYAPEHLIIATPDPSRWLDGVRNAGSVFLGHWTPESLGDYCSGTNHVLPTAGWARSFGGLSVDDFMRSMTVQQASPEGLTNIGPLAVTLAMAEQLEAHARAVTLRLDHLTKAVA